MSKSPLSFYEIHEPVYSGTLIKRYKRFLADVKTESGEKLTLHCPNSGSMKGCSEPGSRIIFSDSGNVKRKYRHTLEVVYTANEVPVGVQTSRANYIVKALIEHGILPIHHAGDSPIRSEVKYGTNSRIDLYFERESETKVFIEVKNTTLKVDSSAQFPDAVTERGQKHLRELANQVEQGNEGIMVYLITRPDCDYFTPAKEIDPEYARLLTVVEKMGVQIIPCCIEFDGQNGFGYKRTLEYRL